MDPEQKAEREITYKVGWKRGKIKQNQATSGAEEPRQPEEDAIPPAGRRAPSWRQWNERWVWRKAANVSDRVLRLMLYALPVVSFGLSLWLVYRLSYQP